MPSAFIYNQTDMKKKRITYGVYGMMEYQAIIKIGRATLKVLFTDGSITSLGQNPAQYTTSDFIVQHAIENSNDFKRGRITVVSTIELDEEVRIERNHNASVQQTATPAKAAVSETATKADAPVQTAEPTEEETATETAPEASEAPREEAEAEEAEAPTEDAEASESMTEMEFDSNDEAKEYLVNTYGVKVSSLKTRANIVAVGETYGVKISFSN